MDARDGRNLRVPGVRPTDRVSDAMRYAPEPPFSHDRMPRVGVLLVNLGTPDAPTPPAVRRYLAEFLADPRVVEIPGLAWRPILHGIVLRIAAGALGREVRGDLAQGRLAAARAQPAPEGAAASAISASA